MSELLSITLFQFLSILSLVTSVFAVVRVGSGSFHRLSHKFDSADVTRSVLNVGSSSPKWSWSGLPTSFSLNTILGEDDRKQHIQEELAVGGYSGGSQLVRMDWQVARPQVAPSIQYQQTPISMAKLIMSRHTQRKPYRIPRRTTGMARSTPSSRLTESV